MPENNKIWHVEYVQFAMYTCYCPIGKDHDQVILTPDEVAKRIMENKMSKREEMIRELAGVFNSHSYENESNTPDFILAEVALDAVDSFNKTVATRGNWWGEDLKFPSPKAEVDNLVKKNEEAYKEEINTFDFRIKSRSEDLGA